MPWRHGGWMATGCLPSIPSSSGGWSWHFELAKEELVSNGCWILYICIYLVVCIYIYIIVIVTVCAIRMFVQMWTRDGSNPCQCKCTLYHFEIEYICKLLSSAVSQVVKQTHMTFLRGCNFCLGFFSFFFFDLFPVFWGLMVWIGICSVLQLSSLICMVLLLWLDGWMDRWMDGWLVG